MFARSRLATIALAVAALCAGRSTALAQLPDQPYVLAGGRLSLAGEVSGVAGKRDEDAYFNYTDYDHSALRLFRVRVFGEWRIAARLSALGELRTENTDQLQGAALYVRWQPWHEHNVFVQAGRIPPVIGAFARRAYGRDNPLIGVPLAYQYLTSLRPDALPAVTDDLLRMRARGWRPSFPLGSHEDAPGIALVSSTRWDTGAEVHWQRERVELSTALTRGAPAVPVVRNPTTSLAWSGRAAASPLAGLTAGISAAHGSWVSRQVLSLLPAGAKRDTAQNVVAADAEFGLGRLLVRAEWIRSTFHLPLADAPGGARILTSSASFLEGRYRFLPQWQVAARVDRLAFNKITGVLFSTRPWDAPVKRVEAVIGYRAMRNLEVRAGWQRNWREGGRVRRRDYPAAQLIYWF